MMRAYRAVLTLRFREVLQYRAAAWAGVFTQVVFGFIILMVLKAFYASSEAEPPLGVGQLLAYVWLGQALFSLMPWNVDREVQAMIRSGAVAYELARPMDTYTLWFCRTTGWRLAAVSLRALPLLVIVAGVFPLVGMHEWALPGPASWLALGAFVAAMVVAILLAVTITMLMHVVMLWTLDAEGITRIAPAIVMLGAGMIIPLPLFPDAVQPLLMALPFRGLLDVPVRLYSGHIPVSEAAAHLALGLAWVVGLVALGRWMMTRGLRQIAVQGG
ncbi:ABC transporter permease [Phycisphaerales bacterium AB-hyl4]|uniref:ABC transporter permease n=1 Tax=Natronomicrosphaera hydrolytica TaxID=3242702 RepID=A0ABV4UAU6_9BACT